MLTPSGPQLLVGYDLPDQTPGLMIIICYATNGIVSLLGAPRVPKSTYRPTCVLHELLHW